MQALILVLFFIGLGLLWAASRRLTALGLPSSRVVYIDTTSLTRAEKPLYDPVVDLTGRPDYLVEESGRFVPVEIKSGRAPLRPYPSHALQLAAYCRLVHAEYSVKPPYGIIRYPDKAFTVDYNAALESQLLDVLAEMRRAERQAPNRSHQSANRCHACGYGEVCDQALD
jgi:CRISPR-associated exonuclease Cas4